MKSKLPSLKIIRILFCLLSILVETSFANSKANVSDKLATEPGKLVMESPDSSLVVQKEMDSLRDSLTLKTEALISIQKKLDSINQSKIILEQNLLAKDSLQKLHLDSLNQAHQSQIDTLQSQSSASQANESKWKKRFIYQIPLAIVLFVLGFGVGGGHFP